MLLRLESKDAISIHRYVHGDNLTICREREYHALDKENLNMDGYDRLAKAKSTSCGGKQIKRNL